MPHYKLYYFNVRGRGEPIRAILRYAGQEFEEESLSFDTWADHKSRFPYGHVPVLEVDGEWLAEMHAITRYLGRKYGQSCANLEAFTTNHCYISGLAGKDAWEEAKVDEFADFHRDVYSELVGYIRAVAGVSIYSGDAVCLPKRHSESG